MYPIAHSFKYVAVFLTITGAFSFPRCAEHVYEVPFWVGAVEWSCVVVLIQRRLYLQLLPRDER